MGKPVYKLRELMYAKYGEDRFALACEIVSRWLKFETKDNSYSMEWVLLLCDTDNAVLDRQVAEALRRLFGLKIKQQKDETANIVFRGSGEPDDGGTVR